MLQSYDVELLIFRTLNPNASPEEWSMEAAAAGQRLAIPDDEPSPFAPRARQRRRRPRTFPALRAGEVQAHRDRRHAAPQPQLPAARAFRLDAAGLSAQRREIPADQLDGAGGLGTLGQVALSRGRYLHLTLDLVYDAPGAAGEPTQRFVLRQSRRMRSNERHYMDSPRFGVIAIVTPSSPSG